MNGEPGPLRPNVAAEARAAARRGAPKLAGSFSVLPGILIAVFVMAVFIILDYTFDQDPHRIFKVALGVLAFGWIIAVPAVGLVVFPIVCPLLPWVPPTPIPGLNPLNLLLFSIFGTYALGRILSHQPIFRASRLGRLLGLLLLICAVSIVRGAAFPTGYTFNVMDATLVLWRSATTFSIYFIVFSMATGIKARRRIWWAVMIGLLVESLVTIKLGRTGAGGRAVGSIGQSNELGSYVGMFAVAAFAGVVGVRNLFGKIVLLATFGAASFALILSLSRGAMVAFVAGLFVVALRGSRLLLVVLLLGLVTSPVWAPDYLKDRITGSQVSVEGSDEVELDKASEARIETWQSIMIVVKAHALEGIGFTGLGYVLPEIGTALGLADVKDTAHNTYLRMLAEMGIVGFGLFLTLLYACWKLGDDTIRAARTAFDRSLGVGLCGATVAMAIGCAFGDRFWNVVIASSFWVICALANDVVAEAPKPASAPAPVARSRTAPRPA